MAAHIALHRPNAELHATTAGGAAGTEVNREERRKMSEGRGRRERRSGGEGGEEGRRRVEGRERCHTCTFSVSPSFPSSSITRHNYTSTPSLAYTIKGRPLFHCWCRHSCNVVGDEEGEETILLFIPLSLRHLEDEQTAN